MLRTLAALTLACLTGCSTLAPHDDWTRRDTALEITWQVANAADMHTTQRIHERHGLIEGNPAARQFLGANPDPRDVIVVGAMGGLSHYLITRLLPPKWRPWWQGGTIALSGHAVATNCDNDLCD